MRITKYSLQFDESRTNVLVKDFTKNITEVQTLNSPEKIVKMFNYVFKANKQTEEYVYLLALDTKMNCKGVFEVSHGAVNYSVVNPREIFIRLCLCGAVYFILAHNHPSGEVVPSKEDINVTNKLKQASEILGIELLDHIIIAENKYLSLKEKKFI